MLRGALAYSRKNFIEFMNEPNNWSIANNLRLRPSVIPMNRPAAHSFPERAQRGSLVAPTIRSCLKNSDSAVQLPLAQGRHQRAKEFGWAEVINRLDILVSRGQERAVARAFNLCRS